MSDIPDQRQDTDVRSSDMSIKAGDVEQLRRLLTEREFSRLMQVVVNDHSQRRIAADEGVCRNAVSQSIESVRTKLAKAGFTIELPGVGRRRVIKAIAVQAGDIDRLVAGRDADGCVKGRWVDAEKLGNN